MALITSHGNCSHVKPKNDTFHKYPSSFPVAVQHIQAHAELLTKAERWPTLAEPTPLRRRHVLRLTHGIARNHQVMNPSALGRTEAHMSHGKREREKERDKLLQRREDEQSRVRRVLVDPQSHSR